MVNQPLPAPMSATTEPSAMPIESMIRSGRCHRSRSGASRSPRSDGGNRRLCPAPFCCAEMALNESTSTIATTITSRPAFALRATAWQAALLPDKYHLPARITSRERCLPSVAHELPDGREHKAGEDDLDHVHDYERIQAGRKCRLE